MLSEKLRWLATIPMTSLLDARIDAAEQIRAERVRGYKMSLEGASGWLYAGETLDDVRCALEQVAMLAELEVGDVVTIEVIEQTRGEVDDMPDFGGW